jgi:flagellar hook-associated protein 1 FlgK
MAGIISTLSIARSALQAQDAAIRTTGQNIANAGNEGYTRQRVVMTAAEPAHLAPGLSIGTGVEISRLERMFDAQIEESIRGSSATLKDLATRSTVLGTVETALNDLAAYGIGPAMDKFFAALNDLAARPEDHTLRSQVVAAADALRDAFGFGEGKLTEIRGNLDDEVVAAAREINRVAGEVAQLNNEITVAENGGVNAGTANDLRDRRDSLVRRLSELTGAKAIETSTGAVNIMVNGDWLVYGRTANELVMSAGADDGVPHTTVRFGGDGKLFSPATGEFAALRALRDETLPEAIDAIDKLAGTFIDQVNRLHSTGEGLARLTNVSGTNAVTSPTAALQDAGLPFTVRDGRFFFTVKNENTGALDSYDIAVDCTDPNNPTSLYDLADEINQAIAADHPEILARVTNDFRLAIDSQSPSVTFGFREDTSGVVSALGLNTFFTGSGARDIDVNALVRNDLDLLAAGHGGGVADNTNVLAMLDLRDQQLINGATLENWWQGRIGALGVARAEARDLAENQQAIHANLIAQREALSGVNLDEEAINLMQYQRAYQAAARLLTVVDELLATLLQAV